LKAVFTDKSRQALVDILYRFANRVERENGEQIFQLMTAGSQGLARPFCGDHPPEIQRVLDTLAQIEGALDVEAVS